ncbi:MAG: hypothetical protein ACJAR1_000647 [Rubritalea sp.]|jgi:hypothetical protein
MDKHSTVIVVGAGASIPYGLPSGENLVTDILLSVKQKIRQDVITTVKGKNGRNVFFNFSTLNPGRNRKDVERYLEKYHDHYHELVRDENVQILFTELKLLEDLSSRTVNSIDFYLESNRDAMLSKVTKWHIANVIRRKEQEEINLRRDGYRDKKEFCSDWLEFLFYELELHRHPERLSQIEFINFNYDRIIERFFDLAFKTHFPKGENSHGHDLLKKHLNMHHVHGSLGNYDRIDYETNDKELAGISKMSETISVMDERGSCDEAKEALVNATTIIFLGFGFDQSNFEKIWDSRMGRDAGTANPRCYMKGSGFKLGASKRKTIESLVGGHPMINIGSEEKVLGNVNETCLGLLENYPCLSSLME